MSITQEETDSRFKLARLHHAFKQDLDVKLIEKILESPGNINYQVANGGSYEGNTALHFIKKYSENQKLKAVKLLLSYGADFTIKNAEEETIILHEVFERLRLESIPYDDFWGLPDKVSVDVVDAILSAHVEKSISKNPVNKDSITHLHIACMTDNALATQFFINNEVTRYRINLAVSEDASYFQGCAPLFIAVKSCAFEVVKVLLTCGASPIETDVDGISVAQWLIECNMQILDCLIIEQVKIKRDKWLSKLKVNQKILDLLLNSYFINSCILPDDIGLSNLHVACTLDNVSLVEDLLNRERAIDHSITANSHLWPGYTAMHFAAHFSLDSVKLLLSKGANLMNKSANGLTPFDICMERYGAKDIYSLMVTQPNWKDITLVDGRTKLLGLVLAMQDITQFKAFLDQYVDNINTSISNNSSLWPGYTVLHLVVLLSEQPKNLSQYILHSVSQFNKIENIVKFSPNLQMIEECLIRGASVTSANVFGCTPLHLAFCNHQSLTIEKLLQYHRSAVNPVDTYNLSHLHIACASQNQDVVRKLLQSGAVVELDVYSHYKYYRRFTNSNRLQVVTIHSGWTPLHIAVACGDPVIVRLLVDSGADVNATDIHDATPIHCLFVQGSDTEYELSRILFSSDNLKEVIAGDSGITHLHVASYTNEENGVRRLLNLGANVDARLGSQSALDGFKDNYSNGEIPPLNYECFAEITALHLTLMRGITKISNILITHGADFITKAPCQECPLDRIIDNYEGNECAITLTRLLSEDIVLARRVEENLGMTLLHLASNARTSDLVKRLIEDGFDVNAQLKGEMNCAGYTPLHVIIKMAEACMYSDGNCLNSDSEYTVELVRDVFEIIRLLLAANADVTLCDAEGNTPLHNQINSSPHQLEFEAELLNLMLNTTKDFRVNPVSKTGWSHFHIACYLNNTAVMENFLKHGVDVNAPIDFFHNREGGSSPLHLVVRKPYENIAPLNIETIDALLLHGADVDAQNSVGDTVLHRTARFAPSRMDIVERLFRAGANIHKLNNNCETPFATLLRTKEATREVIELFIQNGCLVNNFNTAHGCGYLSLRLSVNNSVVQDRADIFQTLFNSPDIARADAAGRTAIHNIVSAADFDISNDILMEEYSWLIKILCRQGCDIDSQDQSGRTALHVASQFKNVKAISALLMNGADINVIDNFENTAFTYSFETCDCKMAKGEHIHTQAIKTFYIYTRKLKYFNLSVNEINRTLMAKANNCPMNFNPNEMEKFYIEENDITTFTYKEESNSICLKDLLSETRIVAMYPHKPSVRAIVDKFYQSMGVYLEDYTEIIGLFELQLRKAVKRDTLIGPAAESLIQLVRFAFPKTCSLVLFKFLSNLDLENLIFATNDPLRMVIDD